MVTLQEHITFLRQLNIPFKKQIVLYLHNLFNDHLSGDKGNELADTTGYRITIEQFIDQIMTTPPPTLPEAADHKEEAKP